MKNGTNFIVLLAVVLAVVLAVIAAFLYTVTDYEKGGVWTVKPLDPTAINWDDENPVRLRASVEEYNAVTVTITNISDRTLNNVDSVEGIVNGYPDIKAIVCLRESDVAKLNIGDTITVSSDRFTYLCLSEKDGKHVLSIGGTEDLTMLIVSCYTARIVDIE